MDPWATPKDFPQIPAVEIYDFRSTNKKTEPQYISSVEDVSFFRPIGHKVFEESRLKWKKRFTMYPIMSVAAVVWG